MALLPDSLRPLEEDTAERMQVPFDYPAVVAVLCLAGVTNRRAAIQPKAADTSWTVVPNLWGGIIAPPGLKKSPVISAVTQPLTRLRRCGALTISPLRVTTGNSRKKRSYGERLGGSNTKLPKRVVRMRQYAPMTQSQRRYADD